jgi:hypothetical protein
VNLKDHFREAENVFQVSGTFPVTGRWKQIQKLFSGTQQFTPVSRNIWGSFPSISRNCLQYPAVYHFLKKLLNREEKRKRKNTTITIKVRTTMKLKSPLQVVIFQKEWQTSKKKRTTAAILGQILLEKCLVPLQETVS